MVFEAQFKNVHYLGDKVLMLFPLIIQCSMQYDIFRSNYRIRSEANRVFFGGGAFQKIKKPFLHE